jgi:hypothetical protein
VGEAEENDIERLFSMSAFEAAYVIRKFKSRNSESSDNDIIATIRAIKADYFPHDYVSGLVLEKAIDVSELVDSLEDFFLAAIEAIIAKISPFWIRIAPNGRDHVLRVLSTNEVQCFRSAGLLDTTQRTIDWWDGLAQKTRSERDSKLLTQGRMAERLSLNYERARLHQEGINQEPQWIALEDNTVGFDILSYYWLNGSQVNRLIEVKSTYLCPPRIILTRNEWDSAVKFGESFEFHLWFLPSETLRILSVSDVRPFIPTDNLGGRWLQTEIFFLE